MSLPTDDRVRAGCGVVRSCESRPNPAPVAPADVMPRDAGAASVYASEEAQPPAALECDHTTALRCSSRVFSGDVRRRQLEDTAATLASRRKEPNVSLDVFGRMRELDREITIAKELGNLELVRELSVQFSELSKKAAASVKEKLQQEDEDQRIELLGMFRSQMWRENDPFVKKLYSAKILLLEGDLTVAALELRDLLSETQNLKDDEIEAVRMEASAILSQAAFAALENMQVALKSSLEQRKGRSVSGDGKRQTEFLDAIRQVIERGDAVTVEDAVAFLEKEDARLKREFANNPVIKKDEHVLIKDSFLPPADRAISVDGGEVVFYPCFGLMAARGQRTIVIGKNGGSVGFFHGRLFHFPPFEFERRVVIDLDQNQITVEKGLIEAIDDTVPWTIYVPVEKKSSLDDFFGEEGLWRNLKKTDPALHALFTLETRTSLEKTQTKDGKRREMLGVAKQMRASQGSYEFAATILEGIIFDSENIEMYGIPTRKEKLDYLKQRHAEGKIEDDVLKEAWEIYVDMMDPHNETFNFADSSVDKMQEEAVVTLVTLPATMGAGSAADIVVGGSKFVMGLVAQGGAKKVAGLGLTFVAGRAAESFGNQVAMRVFTGSEFDLRQLGLSMLVFGAFRGGGALWGRAANRIGLGEKAISAAKGASRVGKTTANFAGSMSTQTLLATGIDYAEQILSDTQSPDTFWERLGGNAIKMLECHYGAKTFHVATGGEFAKMERAVKLKQELAEAVYRERLGVVEKREAIAEARAEAKGAPDDPVLVERAILQRDARRCARMLYESKTHSTAVLEEFLTKFSEFNPKFSIRELIGLIESGGKKAIEEYLHKNGSGFTQVFGPLAPVAIENRFYDLLNILSGLNATVVQRGYVNNGDWIARLAILRLKMGAHCDVAKRFQIKRTPLTKDELLDLNLKQEILRQELMRLDAEVAAHEVNASLSGLAKTIEGIHDKKIRKKIERLKAKLGNPLESSIRWELRNLVTDIFASVAQRVSEGKRVLNRRQRADMDLVADVLVSEGLLSQGLSYETMQNFMREFLSLGESRDVRSMELFPTRQTSNYHHFMLGTSPTAEGVINTLTNNMRGFRRLFGPIAGLMFSRKAMLISEIRDIAGRPSGYFLVVDRARFEAQSGFRISIYDRRPETLSEFGYIGQVSVNFGENSLRIVNVQGAAQGIISPLDKRTIIDRKLGPESKKPVDPNDPEEVVRVAAIRAREGALTGGASPLDMLVAAAIHIGRAAGVSKIEGIKDAAQIARQDAAQTSGTSASYYDPFFRRFGFEGPQQDSDYWTLSMEPIKVTRDPKNLKAVAPTGDRLTDIGQGDLTLAQYMREILVRPGRGRSREWDRQRPSSLAPQVVAFWRGIVGALATVRLEGAREEILDARLRRKLKEKHEEIPEAMLRPGVVPLVNALKNLRRPVSR